MKYFFLTLSFSIIVVTTISAASSTFNTAVWSYRPSYIEGIYSGSSNLSESENQDQKPAYSVGNALSQYALGGLGAIGGGGIGFLTGLGLHWLLGEENDGWGALAAAAVGTAVGLVITRPYLIYSIGNRDGYKGSLLLTFGSYTASMLVLNNFVQGNGTYVLFTDLVSTALASVVHYHTMRPVKKKNTAVTMAPAILYTRNQDWFAGLKMNVSF